MHVLHERYSYGYLRADVVLGVGVTAVKRISGSEGRTRRLEGMEKLESQTRKGLWRPCRCYNPDGVTSIG